MKRIVVEVWNYVSEADIGLLSDYGRIVYVSDLTNQITVNHPPPEGRGLVP